MDQTQTTRYVSRFEPLALRPRLHRKGFLIHYLVHRGLPPRERPPRRICTTREYRTPFSNTASQPRGRPVAKQPNTPLSKRVTTKLQLHLSLEGVNNNLHLYQRGSKPITRSTSTKEGYNKSKGVYNLEASTTSNNLSFSTKQDPNRIG